MKVAKVRTPDGTTLAIRTIDGEGDLIVALHGFTGDGSTMLEIVDQARGDRPALLVDIVGHGYSDAPSSVEPYRMSSVVDQVLSLLGDAEPGSVNLIGYSMGGRIALSIVARAPWFFASITVISATAGLSDPTERQARFEADLQQADEIERLGTHAFIDGWLRQPLFEPLRLSLDEAALENIMEQRGGSSEVGLANSLRGTGTGSMAPVWDAISTMRSPLLAIAGQLDLKYVAEARRLAETTRDGRCVIVSAAGHALLLENLPEVATAISSFLTGCEGNSRAGKNMGES